MNYLLLTCPCLKMILLSMYSMALARSVTKLLCPFELEGNLFSFEELRDLLANSRQGGWKIQIPVMSSLQMPLNAGATAIPPRSMTYKRVLVVHLAPINCLRELASFNHPYSRNQGKFVTFDTTTHHTTPNTVANFAATLPMQIAQLLRGQYAKWILIRKND